MISIIIPVHNEKKNLSQLLPYLIKISNDDIMEVIVSQSNCNSDGAENLDVAGNITFIKCRQKGRAAQMNEAVLAAKGNILVFLHADVKPPKSFLTDIQCTIADGYEAGFFSYRFDRDSFFLKINALFTSKDGIFTGGGDQCLFIKKDVFEKLGAFDEDQVLMEDFEFFDRMKKNNVRYKIIKNDLLVSARKYDNNSYVRVNLSNLILIVLYKFGYSPAKLKTLHNRLLRTTYKPNS